MYVNSLLNNFQTEETGESSHKAVGISLLIGFVFMLLVDQIGGSNHSHASSEIRLGQFCLHTSIVRCCFTKKL